VFPIAERMEAVGIVAESIEAQRSTKTPGGGAHGAAPGWRI
jgi:hypothetical protein